MKRESIVIMSVIITCISIVFIKLSNDHIECKTIKEDIHYVDGSKVSKMKHVCNEKFNL